MIHIRVIRWQSCPDGQVQYRASGLDRHGRYHDFYATTREKAYEGCRKEIEEANLK